MIEVKTTRELIKSEEFENIREELKMNKNIIDDEKKALEWFKPSFLKSLRKQWIAFDDITTKERVFVKHMQDHLENDDRGCDGDKITPGVVGCTICGKDIDQIFEEGK